MVFIYSGSVSIIKKRSVIMHNHFTWTQKNVRDAFMREKRKKTDVLRYIRLFLGRKQANTSDSKPVHMHVWVTVLINTNNIQTSLSGIHYTIRYTLHRRFQRLTIHTFQVTQVIQPL